MSYEKFGIPNTISNCHSEVKVIKYSNTERKTGGPHMPNALGEKIQKLRKKKGLTLEQLATLTGSSKSYIWELENKTPPRPSADKIARIAQHLEVEIDYLLDESGDIAEEDAVDAKFYREYRKMDPATREKIRQMAKLIGREE